MMAIKLFLCCIGVVLLFACSNNKKQPDQLSVPEKVAMSDEAGITLTEGMLFSHTDTICGMDIGNEPEDTLTYHGKLFGFCSSGCKDDFITEHKDK